MPYLNLMREVRFSYSDRLKLFDYLFDSNISVIGIVQTLPFLHTRARAHLC